MRKKDIVLIVVTIVLVLVMIGGFIYDKNDFLLDRTNAIDVPNDSNLKLIDMHKVGLLYYRNAYEAKFQILNGSWESYTAEIELAYGGGYGQLMSYDEYVPFEEGALDGITVMPNPSETAVIWVYGTTIKVNSTENIVYLIDQEDDGNTYLYMYFNRK